MMGDMFSEFQFKIGDEVRHKSSGTKGVVIAQVVARFSGGYQRQYMVSCGYEGTVLQLVEECLKAAEVKP